MKITLFGATGALGGECLTQALDAGHELTVLVRDANKLPAAVRGQVQIVEGNALDPERVQTALAPGTEAVLFAIGVDRASPEDLCTDVTRHILDAMPRLGIRRFVWCGGGSTLVPDDTITFGAKFVAFFGRHFLGLRHRDKDHQIELLESRRDVEWIGLRPLQMLEGPRRETYRVGFDAFSGMSKIHFADCAHAMIDLIDGDAWLHKAPIIQY